MTDTTKPNGDRDRPSDREAAKNPRGPATGPPDQKRRHHQHGHANVARPVLRRPTVTALHHAAPSYCCAACPGIRCQWSRQLCDEEVCP